MDCSSDFCAMIGGEPVCEDVTFYSETHWRGDSLSVEDTADCMDWEPKSVCVPAHHSVTLYDLC